MRCCCDIGDTFDFQTWIEFGPEDTAAFDALRLRASADWRYVDREDDFRLSRPPAA